MGWVRLGEFISEFDQAMHVSQGEEHHQLLVALNLYSFPNIYGEQMSPGLQKIKAIFPHLTSSEAKLYQIC